MNADDYVKMPKGGGEKHLQIGPWSFFVLNFIFHENCAEGTHLYDSPVTNVLSSELLEWEVTFYVQDLVLLKDALKSWLLGFLINTFLKLRLNPKCIYASPTEFALLTN